MLKLKTIKCGDDLYITGGGGYPSSTPITSDYFINGEQRVVEDTHLRDWVKVVGVSYIETLQKRGSKVPVNTRWELINPVDVSLGVPLSFPAEDSSEYYCDEDYIYKIGYNCQYKRFSSLYERKSDYKDGEIEDVEFEVVSTQEVTVEEVTNFKDMKITTHMNSYTKEPVVRDLSSIVCYSDIERLLVHPLAIHNRPCSVSKDTTYNIVRNHIKMNINPHHARITSDYDFCFTVKKLIQIKPIELKRELKKANGKSYAKPKFNTSTKHYKEVDLFEMCPSKKYGKYTPIDGFKGDNLEDLAENIKLYLDELMSVINAPVHECEHCKGVGSVVKEIDSNKR